MGANKESESHTVNLTTTTAFNSIHSCDYYMLCGMYGMKLCKQSKHFNVSISFKENKKETGCIIFCRYSYIMQ